MDGLVENNNKKNYFKPNVVPILKCTQGFGKYIFTCVATFTLNRYTCLFIIFQENKGYYELITNTVFHNKGFRAENKYYSYLCSCRHHIYNP